MRCARCRAAAKYGRKCLSCHRGHAEALPWKKTVDKSLQKPREASARKGGCHQHRKQAPHSAPDAKGRADSNSHSDGSAARLLANTCSWPKTDPEGVISFDPALMAEAPAELELFDFEARVRQNRYTRPNPFCKKIPHVPI